MYRTAGIHSLTLLCGPLLNPAMRPLLSPAMPPLLSPAMRPLLNPAMPPLLSPAMPPLLSPAMRPLLNPAMRPLLSPAMRPLLNPAMRPLLSPAMRPLLNPAMCPLLNPAMRPLPVFSLGCFWGGAAPPFGANIPPYQCFRGCCTPHKSHGMQSRSAFNNYHQTVIHMQVHSNRLCNSSTRGG